MRLRNGNAARQDGAPHGCSASLEHALAAMSDQIGPDLTAAEIAEGFTSLLGRPPESAAVVAHYLSLGLRRPQFLQALLRSDEFAERQRQRLAVAALDDPAEHWAAGHADARVLLFGAYGNGNLGDAAQAEALAWALRRMLPGRLSLAATSWERHAPYRLPGGAVLAPDTLLRPDRLTPHENGAAWLVVIGGGGLFGAPHFPLHDPAWARWFATRGVPYALLGVGGAAAALAQPACADAYRTLMGGALFVGGRDEETLQALRPIRADAAWFPDPVLLWALSQPPSPPGPRPIDLLLIPRFPNSPADSECNRLLLARRARAAAGERVVVAALEPELDRQALRGEPVEYVADWRALMALCRESRSVATLRLHGAVAGIAAGCVVHGLVQPKTGALMRDLGVGRWFSGEGWPEIDPAGFHEALRHGLLAFRQRAGTAMAAAGAALAPAIA